jgi:hypothetical protein
MTYLRVNEREKTAWRLHCPYHGIVYLTREEYMAQMAAPDSKWKCPAFDNGDPTDPNDPGPGVCGAVSSWDDHWYEAWMDDLQIE